MATLLPIRDFWKRPRQTDTAVILGKGPSLDGYRPVDNPPGAYVLGINEVGMAFDCDGIIYLDQRLASFRFRSRNPDADIFCQGLHPYEGEGDAYQFACGRLGLVYPKECHLEYVGTGSGPYAISIMALWGIDKLIMWGFDRYSWLDGKPNGTPLYASCIKDVVLGTQMDWDYRQINESIRETIRKFGVNVRFMHLGKSAK